MKKALGLGAIGCGALLVLGLCVGGALAVAMRGGLGATATPAVTATPPSAIDATAVDPRALVADPTSYAGRNLSLQGRVLTVAQHPDYTWFQLLALAAGRQDQEESVVVELRPKGTVLEGDCVRVFAVGAGTARVTRTLTGAADTAPLVAGYAVESAPADGAGGCAAPTAP